jgi:hypothetical protein
MLGVSEGQILNLRRALLPESQRAPMKGQGRAALKGFPLLISRRQDPRPLLHALRLMNLLLERGLMGAAHDVFRGDTAFANAQTPLLFLGTIVAGGMENISLVVHKQLPRIGNALPTARALRVWLMWSWAQSPFCRTLWKSMTIGWTLSFIRILRAILS